MYEASYILNRLMNKKFCNKTFFSMHVAFIICLKPEWPRMSYIGSATYNHVWNFDFKRLKLNETLIPQ